MKNKHRTFCGRSLSERDFQATATNWTWKWGQMGEGWPVTLVWRWISTVSRKHQAKQTGPIGSDLLASAALTLSALVMSGYTLLRPTLWTRRFQIFAHGNIAKQTGGRHTATSHPRKRARFECWSFDQIVCLFFSFPLLTLPHELTTLFPVGYPKVQWFPKSVAFSLHIVLSWFVPEEHLSKVFPCHFDWTNWKSLHNWNLFICTEHSVAECPKWCMTLRRKYDPAEGEFWKTHTTGRPQGFSPQWSAAKRERIVAFSVFFTSAAVKLLCWRLAPNKCASA